MSLRNTYYTYGSLAKFFHWSISTLTILIILVGFFMGDFEKPFRFTLVMLHKSTGLVILALMLARTYWMITNPKPALPQSEPWERLAMKTTHFALYLLMFTMPLSGWLMSSAAGYHPSFYGFGSLPMPGIDKSEALASIASNVHTFAAWTLVGLLVLHILAALKHHLINKDDVLKRMMPTKQD